ncbi:hypothetical protein [Pseudoalteromonas byunsanensis]|uniref:hypothetical protein n=1 Tax=Pseudoalteromonas byunsanensis TaxID=327939 RepID=UPI001585FA1F|nr:hypothetical protein [Pseudoalteromonas byunsanensis]
MKIKLHKKPLKKLSESSTLPRELTPQAAGGMYATSPHNKGCISYLGMTCPTSPYDPAC